MLVHSTVFWLTFHMCYLCAIVPIQTEAYEIHGAIVPVFTPIDEAGEINFEVISIYVNFLYSHGIDYILVGGKNSEFLSMSLTERRDVLRAFASATKDLGVKMLVQVGGMPLPDSIKLAEYAESFKADAILVHPDLYYRPTDLDELIMYLEVITDCAPSKPILYYHSSVKSLMNFTLRDIFDLATHRLENLKGVATDLMSATEVIDVIKPDQVIIIDQETVGPVGILGLDAYMSVFSNLFPRMVVDTHSAIKRSDVPTAVQLQLETIKLRHAILAEGGLAAMKAAMEMVTGIKVGPTRLPRVALDEHQKRKIADNLKRRGVVVDSLSFLRI